ncbi:protein-tyrosine phosphatase-like protein [Cercophora scortea]|uniref:phosphatidylinositol-3,4,5-trisphosphate 3-phosphatase n=1 Tax=Cercophora scortea TaxID=314031 RepID=A0AAE0IER9_9PEZI|nr:protein-tyrosine phosphatase-like protein [Cercophora scortea]
MASLLRQIVAGPRAKHQETGLDLCYVTSNIIATSGPSQAYPQRAYRNPLDRLVAFLDAQHGDGWAIWEFRAEGTGYPDEAVYNRIRHYPYPDHHPPSFRIVPMVMASMRNWLAGGELEGGKNKGKGTVKDGEEVEKKKGDRVVVVHCKAGKGRSGTMACSYLIAECGWTPQDALARFTERRMRPKFGNGVSIPSQLRWVGYVDRWTKGGKVYVDREIEIVEVHVWGLRHGVKLEVEGFVEEGRKIRVFHTFRREERIVVEGDAPGGRGVVDLVYDLYSGGGEREKEKDGEGEERSEVEDDGEGDGEGGKRLSRGKSVLRKLSVRSKSRSSSSQSLSKLDGNGKKSSTIPMPETSETALGGGDGGDVNQTQSRSTSSLQGKGSSGPSLAFADSSEPGGQAVIFKPATPIRIPNSDVNIVVERRNRAPASMGLTMVTAVAHVWFNAFFEGNGPEQAGKADDSGVFEIDWDAMDGIKGSSQKGTRACDRISVVWRVVGSGAAVVEPGEDSPVPQMPPADWKGGNREDPTADKRLGLRVQDPESESVSMASSFKSLSLEGDGGKKGGEKEGESLELEGVKSSGPEGEEVLDETPGGKGAAGGVVVDVKRT